MAKRELKVTLETVTPLFMAGIDQNTPELRPPSILGPLRYWLRAALGGVVGNNLDALKRAEAEVFGDTAGTGAVQIKRVRWLDKSPELIEEYALLHKQAAKMKGFPAGKRFELVLTQHISNDSTWLAAISALLLMVSIGGLGRRCRRGWGTVRMVQVDTTQAALTKVWEEVLMESCIRTPPKSLMIWEGYVKTARDVAVYCVKDLCKTLKVSGRSNYNRTLYTVAASDRMKLYKNDKNGDTYESYKKAIEDFGENEYHWLKANRSLAKSIGSAMGGRQASPLWLRVLPLSTQNGTVNYIMLATLFDVDFKDSNYEAVQKFLKSANFEEVK